MFLWCISLGGCFCIPNENNVISLFRQRYYQTLYTCLCFSHWVSQVAFPPQWLLQMAEGFGDPKPQSKSSWPPTGDAGRFWPSGFARKLAKVRPEALPPPAPPPHSATAGGPGTAPTAVMGDVLPLSVAGGPAATAVSPSGTGAEPGLLAAPAVLSTVPRGVGAGAAVGATPLPPCQGPPGLAGEPTGTWVATVPGLSVSQKFLLLRWSTFLNELPSAPFLSGGCRLFQCHCPSSCIFSKFILRILISQCKLFWRCLKKRKQRNEGIDGSRNQKYFSFLKWFQFLAKKVGRKFTFLKQASE